MAKIGEIHVTMKGMRDVKRSAAALATCMEGCRIAFEKLVSDLGEVLADSELESERDHDTELE